jgi:Fic family protein
MLNNANLPGKFKDIALILVDPPFNSNLTDLIIDLDYLRKRPLKGSTHPATFFQLKKIFHTLESIGSARIEGNRTTLAEFIETKIENTKTNDEGIVEIQNMENALSFIDETIGQTKINRAFLSELHKRVVDNLQKEGSENPGGYRKKNVRILGSNHIPPESIQVQSYMDEFFDFINKIDPPKYDLLKSAIAHHRFVWIHPFDNGNGRTVRLLTYAMLVKQGFNVKLGRIINPTAVFCNDRNKYYNALSKADSGTADGTLKWCEYVLAGLKEEIQKIDKLLNFSYLLGNILLPTIEYSLERKFITNKESEILKVIAQKQVIKAADLKDILPDKIPASISRMIKSLINKKMVAQEKPNSRKYVLCFSNNYLFRGIINMLDKNGFLPIPIDK